MATSLRPTRRHLGPLTLPDASGSWQDDIALGSSLLVLAGLFYFVPWAPLYVPLLAAVAALSWRRLDLALSLPIVFAPAFMLPKHLGSEEFAPSEIFIVLDALIAVGWLLRSDLRPRLQPKRLISSPFARPATLLLFAGALSTVFAADRHVALRAYREVLFEPVLWFGLMLMVQTRLTRWAAGIAALLIAGVTACIVAIGQLVSGQDLTTVAGSSIPRVKALYGSSDNFGLLLDRVIPVWLAVELALRRRVTLLCWSAVGLILAIGLAFSFSRGAWLAIGVAAIALAWRCWWGRRLALLAVLVVMIALALGGKSTVRAVTSGHSNTVQQRVYLWQSAVHMIRDHPLFGVGPDNFLTYYAPTRKQDLWQHECSPGRGYMVAAAGAEPCLSHPHNEVLDFWLSTGILGLAAFLWLQVVFWRQALVSYACFSGWTRVVVTGVMGAMLAALIHGLVDNSYFLEDLAILFWLLCAFVSFLAHERPQMVTA